MHLLLLQENYFRVYHSRLKTLGKCVGLVPAENSPLAM